MRILSVLILILMTSATSLAQENLYRLSDEKTYVSYIDKTGKLIFKADLKDGELWDFGNYRNGYLTVNYSKAQKSVIFDNRGNKTFVTDSLYFFFESDSDPNKKFAAIVQRMIKGKRDPRGPEAVIDEKGNFIVPLDKANYHLRYAGQGKFVRMYGPNYIDLIDEHGKFLERYPAANFSGGASGFYISENLIRFKFKEVDFKEIIPPKNTVEYGKWGYMDINKNIIIAPKYYGTDRFSEGFATVITANNDYTIINKKGEPILNSDFDNYFIPTRSDNHDPRFVNGLANICVVAKNDEDKKLKCGYIDSLSKWVIQPEYVFASQFSGGLAMVVDKSQKTVFINTKGATILSGFWDNRDHNNCWWDKNVIYVKSINTYFNHKGEKLGKPATVSYITIDSPVQLSNLSEKDLLSVGVIRLTDSQIISDNSILQKVYKCKNLRELSLEGRNLDEGGISFEDIYKLSYLESLNLDFSNISALPGGISKLKNLKSLSLNYTSIEKLPDDLHLLKLNRISIAMTPLTGSKKLLNSLRTHVKVIYGAEDSNVISNEQLASPKN